MIRQLSLSFFASTVLMTNDGNIRMQVIREEQGVKWPKATALEGVDIGTVGGIWGGSVPLPRKLIFLH